MNNKKILLSEIAKFYLLFYCFTIFWQPIVVDSFFQLSRFGPCKIALHAGNQLDVSCTGLTGAVSWSNCFFELCPTVEESRH